IILIEKGEELDRAGLWGGCVTQVWGASLALSPCWDVEDKVAVVVLNTRLWKDWVDGRILRSEWRSVVLRSGKRSCGSNGSNDGSDEDLGELHIENYKAG